MGTPLNTQNHNILALPDTIVQRWTISTVDISPVVKPKPSNFDLSRAIKKLRQIFILHQTGKKGSKPAQPTYNLSWRCLKLPTILSREEAKFWLAAIIETHKLKSNSYLTDETIETLIKATTRCHFFEALSLLSILLQVRPNRFSHAHHPPTQLAICLLNLFSVEELIEALDDASIEEDSSNRKKLLNVLTEAEIKRFVEQNSYRNLTHTEAIETLVEQEYNRFNRYVVQPVLFNSIKIYREELWRYRTQAEVEALKSFVRSKLSTIETHLCQRELFNLTLKLNMRDKLLTIVEQAQPNGLIWVSGLGAHTSPQEIILSLESPSDVRVHMQRLHLYLTNKEEIEGWLCRLQAAGLPYVCESILRKERRKEAKALIKVVGRVRAPKVAVCMLELSLAAKTAEYARAWLRKHPQLVIEGLVPIASGEDRLSKAALRYLQDLHLKGHTKRLNKAIAAQPKDKAQILTEKVLERKIVSKQSLQQFDRDCTPEWLQVEIDAMEASGNLTKLPRWLPIITLPPVRIGTINLNESQTAALVSALQASTLDNVHPLVRAIQQHAAPASARAFAATLFERWRKEDMPARNKWVMWAAAHFQSLKVAAQLGPLIVKWRKQLKHVRVTWGMETLAAMKNDAALMQLHYVSEKAHRPALRDRASELLRTIASARGLSMSALEDRIVPNCGLDSSGHRTIKRQ